MNPPKCAAGPDRSRYPWSKKSLSVCCEQCNLMVLPDLISNRWLYFLHENRLWTTVSSLSPYQEQQSYPKLLTEMKMTESYLGRQSEQSQWEDQHIPLSSFCAAADKKEVSKSYLWQVLLTIPPHVGYSCSRHLSTPLVSSIPCCWPQLVTQTPAQRRVFPAKGPAQDTWWTALQAAPTDWRCPMGQGSGRPRKVISSKL